jgi:hypothetical protein
VKRRQVHDPEQWAGLKAVQKCFNRRPANGEKFRIEFHWLKELLVPGKIGAAATRARFSPRTSAAAAVVAFFASAFEERGPSTASARLAAIVEIFTKMSLRSE